PRGQWRVRQHDPVGFGQAAVSLRAKRGPRLGLAFLLDLFTCAPRGLNDRHHSITSGSGNRPDSGAFGPWTFSSVTSSCPSTSSAKGLRQSWLVVSKADTSSAPSGRPLTPKVPVCPSRVAVIVSPAIAYDS